MYVFKNRYIIILLTARTEQAGGLSDRLVRFAGAMCIQTQATSFSCETISFSFKRKKKTFAVGMSVRSNSANVGVWKLTDQSLPG